MFSLHSKVVFTDLKKKDFLYSYHAQYIHNRQPAFFLKLADPNAGAVLDGKVVAAAAVIDLINSWQSQAPLEGMLIGNGTSSDY